MDRAAFDIAVALNAAKIEKMREIFKKLEDAGIEMGFELDRHYFYKFDENGSKLVPRLSEALGCTFKKTFDSIDGLVDYQATIDGATIYVWNSKPLCKLERIEVNVPAQTVIKYKCIQPTQ